MTLRRASDVHINWSQWGATFGWVFAVIIGIVVLCCGLCNKRVRNCLCAVPRCFKDVAVLLFDLLRICCGDCAESVSHCWHNCRRSWGCVGSEQGSPQLPSVGEGETTRLESHVDNTQEPERTPSSNHLPSRHTITVQPSSPPSGSDILETGSIPPPSYAEAISSSSGDVHGSPAVTRQPAARVAPPAANCLPTYGPALVAPSPSQTHRRTAETGTLQPPPRAAALDVEEEGGALPSYHEVLETLQALDEMRVERTGIRSASPRPPGSAGETENLMAPPPSYHSLCSQPHDANV